MVSFVIKKMTIKIKMLQVVADTYNPSTLEVEASRSL